jgi:hypothetical protein
MFGFILAAAIIYPYSFFGIYVGPLLLILGLTGWISNYYRTYQRLPNPLRSFSKSKGPLDFLFSYLLHFWTGIIAFWIGIAFLGTAFFKNSYAFQVSTEYVESDVNLKERIGPIEYYGFLVGGHISSSGSAELSFSIVGENGKVTAKSFIKNKKVSRMEYK